MENRTDKKDGVAGQSPAGGAGAVAGPDGAAVVRVGDGCEVRASDVVLSALDDADVGLADAGRPVYDTVDLDAVDELFRRRTGAPVSITFEYRDHEVVVEGDAEVTVSVHA